ncbi:MAG TPA: hypothetical protein EYP90_02470, partial [Chromatiaceae bacterium]|nr:hypothetical protein [Chromatiaceae bacterium]
MGIMLYLAAIISLSLIAKAFGNYAVTFLPSNEVSEIWHHSFSIGVIVLFVLINLKGAKEGDLDWDDKEKFDLNGDGKVWEEDFTIFTDNFGGPAGSLPEGLWTTTQPGQEVLITPEEEKEITIKVADRIEFILTDLVQSTHTQYEIASGISISVLLPFDFGFDSIRKIVGWLSDPTTEVVNCAVLAFRNLMNLFGKKVSEFDTVEVATNMILSDILTGVIRPDNAQGKLATSMFAIKKAAQAESIGLTGDYLTFEELKNIGSPVVAHVGGNHWVVV